MMFIDIKYHSTWQTHTCLRTIPFHMHQDTRELFGGITFNCQSCGRSSMEVRVEEGFASNGTIDFRFHIRDMRLGENRPFTVQESRIGDGKMVSEQVRSRFVIAGNNYTIFVLTWVGLDGTVLTLVDPADFPVLEQDLHHCLHLIRDVPALVVEEDEEDEEDVDENDAMNDEDFERWLAGGHPLIDLANAMIRQADGMNPNEVEVESEEEGEEVDAEDNEVEGEDEGEKGDEGEEEDEDEEHDE